MRESLQGIEPPAPRTEEDFDPAAKYHIAADVEYMRWIELKLWVLKIIIIKLESFTAEHSSIWILAPLCPTTNISILLSFTFADYVLVHTNPLTAMLISFSLGL